MGGNTGSMGVELVSSGTVYYDDGTVFLYGCGANVHIKLKDMDEMLIINTGQMYNERKIIARNYVNQELNTFVVENVYITATSDNSVLYRNGIAIYRRFGYKGRIEL